MVYVGSVGLGIPRNSMSQQEVRELVMEIFPDKVQKRLTKLLPIFENAQIKERQFVVERNWFKQEWTWKETNDIYIEQSINLSLKAIDQCLQQSYLKQSIPYEAIDMIIFVSSSGIATPSIDARILNQRPFREDVIRMPLWGLGCAGGAMGLSRGLEWGKLHPQKNVLIIAAELCSLTFQKSDVSTSNLVGTALFGDGVAATLLIGTESKYRDYLRDNKLKLLDTSSYTKKNTINIMGWNISEKGFEVIFSKEIPSLIKTIWKPHITSFLKNHHVMMEDVGAIIAHPGGRKVLEEMESSLPCNRNILKYSFDVLANHGNMSSATVMYVLEKWLNYSKQPSIQGKKGIVSALGPGFSSELLLVEWIAV